MYIVWRGTMYYHSDWYHVVGMATTQEEAERIRVKHIEECSCGINSHDTTVLTELQWTFNPKHDVCYEIAHIPMLGDEVEKLFVLERCERDRVHIELFRTEEACEEALDKQLDACEDWKELFFVEGWFECTLSPHNHITLWKHDLPRGYLL